MFFLIPIVSLLISWSYFQLISPPLPSFTKEDAVEFETSGEGTFIDEFPKEIEDEVYIVTFTENWSKGIEKDSWTLSYKVDRDGSEINEATGNMPPYYEDN